MGKKSKPFIDKKKPETHSFRLVHRSHHDPLAGESEVSPFVLQPVVDGNQQRKHEEGRSASGSEVSRPFEDENEQDSDEDVVGGVGHGKAARKHDGSAAKDRSRKYNGKAELAQCGVFFEDDYDYTRHLRTRGAPGAEMVAVDPAMLAAYERSTGRRPGLSAAALHAADLSLPRELLAGPEIPSDPRQRGIITGPQPDWDPDVVSRSRSSIGLGHDIPLDERWPTQVQYIL